METGTDVIVGSIAGISDAGNLSMGSDETSVVAAGSKTACWATAEADTAGSVTLWS